MSHPNPPELPDGNVFPEVREAKRRGYTVNWWRYGEWDEEEGLEVRDANDNVLSSIHGPLEFVDDESIGAVPDWRRTMRLELMWAIKADDLREARREARPLKTRLRRAWAALCGEPQT